MHFLNNQMFSVMAEKWTNKKYILTEHFYSTKTNDEKFYLKDGLKGVRGWGYHNHYVIDLKPTILKEVVKAGKHYPKIKH